MKVEKVSKPCEQCGSIMTLLPCHARVRRFCSHGCFDNYQRGNGVVPTCVKCGNRSTRQNRLCLCCYLLGVKKDKYSPSNGYVKVPLGSGRSEYEHRIVMARVIGRPLRPYESVHHINGDGTDNRPENLRLYEDPGVHVLSEGHVAFDARGKFTAGINRKKVLR